MPSHSNKYWNYFTDHGWRWLLLLSCSAIFLFPFLWMIVSSIKTEEEVGSQEFWPEMPEFRACSPYVIDAPEPVRPSHCPEDRWQRLLPKFQAHTTLLVTQDAARPSLLNNDQEDEKLTDAASEFLIQRGVEKMSQQSWLKKNDDDVEASFQAALRAGGGVQKELTKAYKKTHARLILHGIKVRSSGVGVIHQEKFLNQTSNQQLPAGLRVSDQSHGELRYDADGALVLKSQFTSPSDPPVEVLYQFQVDCPADEIYRIIIPFTYDASWHQIDAEVTINGTRYQGSRSTWLAQNKTSALTLQFSGNDADEWGKRPWVTMTKLEDGPTAERKTCNITLKLNLSPSSTTTARAGKVKRNYQRVFLSMPFWKYVINSALITVLSIFGAVASASFVAYAFARLKWPGRSVAFVVLLSTMMLPPQVTMIPQFLIWREIGWYNTLNPIWVPTWFGVAFFIFLMVQQMKSIPRDLEEAAEIDGMNRFQTWYYVILPLVKPAMAAIAIMSFMASWNEFMAPLIYLRDMDRFPLSVGIYAMAADETMTHDMSLILAGNLLMTFPVIVIFFIFQRYFIQGVASAGVKG